MVDASERPLTAFDKAASGNFGMLYLIELSRQARMCVQVADEVLMVGDAFAKGEPVEGSLGRLLEQVLDCVGCAARLRNLLIEHQRRDANRELWQFGAERIKWLQSITSGVEIPTIRSVRTRDTLEHFDERMDALALASVTGDPGRPPKALLFDGVYKSRQEELADGTPCVYARVYIADEAVFLNPNDELPLRKLRDEAQAVLDKVRPIVAAYSSTWINSGAPPQVVLAI